MRRTRDNIRFLSDPNRGPDSLRFSLDEVSPGRAQLFGLVQISKWQAFSFQR